MAHSIIGKQHSGKCITEQAEGWVALCVKWGTMRGKHTTAANAFSLSLTGQPIRAAVFDAFFIVPGNFSLAPAFCVGVSFYLASVV